MTSPHSHSRRTGFTLVEVLVAIVIIGVLIALLLPVIAGAVRTARNAQVSGEEQVLMQALASFKNQYGDYPPSRILLAEDGLYPTSDTTPLAVTGGADITVGQLASRSIQFLRKFFPRANFSSTTSLYTSSAFHDFDGDGSFYTVTGAAVGKNSHAYILDGRQCLAFFLGGIPQRSATTVSLTGFGKNPTNPFVGPSVTANRSAPQFEFVSGRLSVPPNMPAGFSGGSAAVTAGFPGFPGYMDTLLSVDQNGQPSGYYAYFSAYGNNAYDPNDVNISEQDSSGTAPVMSYFNVAFPVVDTSGSSSLGPGTPGKFNYAKSPDPNPYCASLGADLSSGAVNWINPNSFQIISPGADGVYGPGGQYLSSGSGELLPLDTNSSYNTSDTGIRIFERDNIGSFHNGKLE